MWIWTQIRLLSRWRISEAIPSLFVSPRRAEALHLHSEFAVFWGKRKEDKKDLTQKARVGQSQTKYFCVQLSGLLYTNRLRNLQEGRMPRVFRDVFLRPCFVSFRRSYQPTSRNWSPPVHFTANAIISSRGSTFIQFVTSISTCFQDISSSTAQYFTINSLKHFGSAIFITVNSNVIILKRLKNFIAQLKGLSFFTRDMVLIHTAVVHIYALVYTYIQYIMRAHTHTHTCVHYRVVLA